MGHLLEKQLSSTNIFETTNKLHGVYAPLKQEYGSLGGSSRYGPLA